METGRQGDRKCGMRSGGGWKGQRIAGDSAKMAAWTRSTNDDARGSATYFGRRWSF